MNVPANCPRCGHTGRAPENAVGRRIACPKCSYNFLLQVDTAAAPEPFDIAILIGAIQRDNASEIATLISRQDFTLIERPDDSEGDARAAMTGEVDDYPVLLAFISSEHASRFADTAPELLEADGTVPGFVVEGSNLMAYLPEGFGLLLNLESDDSVVLPPELVDRIRRCV